MDVIKEYVEQADWNKPNELNVLFRKLRDEFYRDQSFPYKVILDQIEELDPVLCDFYFPKKKGGRRDGRSLGQFGLDIYHGTIDEQASLNEWFEKFGKDHMGEQEFVPSGIDGSGALTLECDGMETPDFKMANPHPKYGTHIEYKTNVCEWKWTYKKTTIDECARSNSSILTVLKNRRGEIIMYTLMTPAEVKVMAAMKDQFCWRKELKKDSIQFYWGMSESVMRVKRKSDDLSPLVLPLEDYCAIIKRV